MAVSVVPMSRSAGIALAASCTRALAAANPARSRSVTDAALAPSSTAAPSPRNAVRLASAPPTRPPMPSAIATRNGPGVGSAATR